MGRFSVPLVSTRLRWAAVAVVAAGIVVASVSPSSGAAVRGPLGVVGADKYLHALAFAGFALVLAYALARRDPTVAAVAVLVGTVAFGLAIELLQLPLAHRSFDWLDLVADAVGATVVAVGWRLAAVRVRFRRVDVGGAGSAEVE